MTRHATKDRSPRRLALQVAACALAMCAYAEAQTSLTRSSAFEYDLSTGQLIREVVEPNDPALCVVTTYQYDPYGNRKSATTRNCNGVAFNDGQTPAEAPAPSCAASVQHCNAIFTARTSSTSFDATAVNALPGQFATSSMNALQQQEFREFNPTWTYERCADLSPNPCPAWLAVPTGRAAFPYRVRATTTGAPETSTYFDSLNRPVRTETQGFDGTPVRKDTQYDARGRVARISQPFITEGTQVWTSFSYDILNRVTQVDEPTVNSATARTITSYNGLVTATTVGSAGVSGAVTGTGMPGGAVQTKTVTRNSQGQVVTITRQ